MALTDNQYYSRFEGRVRPFLVGQNYAIGDIIKVRDLYYQLTNMAIMGPSGATDADGPITFVGTDGTTMGTNTNWIMFEAPVLGENRMINLKELVDNYMVLFSDEDSHGGKMPRMKVEALAKRAIQEYNYDTCRVQDFEYELLDIARVPFPQDLVEVVSLNWVDDFGIERWLIERKDSSSPRSPLQHDEDISTGNALPWDNTASYLAGNVVQFRGKYYRATGTVPVNTVPSSVNNFWVEIPTSGYVYDDNGNVVFTDGTSVTKELYDRSSNRQLLGRGQIVQGNAYYYSAGAGFNLYGKRYYLETELANSNGTYVIDHNSGAVDLDPALIGRIVTMRYVSDGLTGSPEEIVVHKFAEDAIYEYIYYMGIAKKRDVPMNEKQRAQRSMSAKKRTAKLRLSNISKRELLQTLRGQARWIKT